MAGLRKLPADRIADLRSRLREGICALVSATRRPVPTICVGFSGGLDSSVLLDLLAGEADAGLLRVIALHVNHGLSPNADAWSHHCECVCEAMNIELRTVRARIAHRARRSLEEEAREARYAAFGTVKADAVALAQHADDQAETLLLQLLRGAGPKGLASMQILGDLPTAVGGPLCWRPLLEVDQKLLRAYASHASLTWIEDESNLDCRLRRNYLRHRIMPLLGDAFPAPARMLTRASMLQAKAAALLDDLAEIDLKAVTVDGGLDCPQLSFLSPERQANALRRWLAKAGARSPSLARLAALLKAIADSSNDTRLEWLHENLRVVRQRATLSIELRSLLRRSYDDGAEKS